VHNKIEYIVLNVGAVRWVFFLHSVYYVYSVVGSCLIPTCCVLLEIKCNCLRTVHSVI